MIKYILSGLQRGAVCGTVLRMEPLLMILHAYPESKSDRTNSGLGREKLMNNSVFRKKSLERISSPEQINDYIRVITPGMWILLIVIILLVIAGIAWGLCVTLTVTDVNSAGEVVKSTVSPISYVIGR